MQKVETKNNTKQIILTVSVLLVIIFFLGPILWQILTSIKTNEEISAIPNVYIPSQITFEHYRELFLRRPFALYIFNSALVSISSTVICLIVGSPAAYVLARLRIPGKNIILSLVLVVSLFPYVLLFLGLLEVIKILGLGNNYLALIIPYTGIIPMLIKILLPMTLPALVTTGILTFIFAWNEYIFALTFITRETMKTIPVATAQIGGATVFEIPYGPIAAATVLGTLPLVLLVLFFQRRIVEGLTAGAVKG